MNLEKTIVDGDLWYIDNFLTEEELAWLKPWMDDPKDWYVTMRSPYKNILNKFIESVNRYDENGNVLPPDPMGKKNPDVDLSLFEKPGGIWDRIKQVVPPVYSPNATLQSFKYVPEDEIVNLLSDDYKDELKRGFKIDFAMNWHYDSNADHKTIAAFSIYLNDDFEGGNLEFMNKPYVIEPKAGRFVNVPTTKEFTHRVSKITSGNNRHTLYGRSWASEQDVIHSDNC